MNWIEFKNNYSIGDIVTGKIVQKTTFGVFLDIGEPFYVLLQVVKMIELNYDLYLADKQFKIGETITGEVIGISDHNKQMDIKQIDS